MRSTVSRSPFVPLRQAAPLCAFDSGALCLRSAVLLEAGLTIEAVEAAQQAVAMASSSSPSCADGDSIKGREARLQLAKALRAADLFDDALSVCRQALSLAGRDAGAMRGLAAGPDEAQALEGEIKRAREARQQRLYRQARRPTRAGAAAGIRNPR